MTMKKLELSVWTDARPTPGETDGRRRYAELLDEVRLIDRLSYRALCTTEQHGVDDGYLPAQLTLIAGLGTITERIRFVTNTLLPLFYPLRIVVEEAIVADLLSGGRLELGVAVGGYAREFDLFGVDITQRGRLMENAVRSLRMGLYEGRLPDGKQGAKVPVLPRPAQEHIPIYHGGLAPRVIDRAVRLTDGVLPIDFLNPEKGFPEFWQTRLQPALERHGRSIDDFRFSVCSTLWASEDPERDWNRFLRSAREYQFSKYAEWAGGWGEPGLPKLAELARRDRLLVDTPENIARRLRDLQASAPIDEFIFWYRTPGISHERAMEHLELVEQRVIPLLTTDDADGNRDSASEPTTESTR
jgi:alkanesulfonate monooxygenase SsuD/methylene tetrahydromethanopterin reductase-like flavin-dependent oxidoreductase (luciferase family)